MIAGVDRSVQSGEVERFRSVLASRLGLQFDETRSGLLGEVLRRRLAATRQTCEQYLDDVEGATRTGGLDGGQRSGEFAALAGELTVPETYFFRNGDQFQAFSELVVPDLQQRATASGAPLQLLSAGCASGEEAYSLAITLRKALGASYQPSILAVDINPAALERARLARYSGWSLRETSPADRDRWFSSVDGGHLLDESIRTAVQFECRNLTDDEGELWRPGRYDVIFCRNVMMYFTPDAARTLVERITGALRPGGYLFLGHAETLRGLSADFHLCHTNHTFYYRRKLAHESADRSRQPAIPPHPGAKPGKGAGNEAEQSAVAAAIEQTDCWVDTIRLASERVLRLTDARQPPPSARTPVGPALPVPIPIPAVAIDAGSGHGAAVAERATRPWDLGSPMELLRQERFADALGLVRTLPAEAARDPDVLLLQAALLAHSGLLTDAERACRRLLDIDQLSAGAHYLLALCHEGAGNRPEAAEQDRIAAHLDPGFAMPHLHLGLLARRIGTAEAAHREFHQAIALLRREDASRILLFGGGFSREALMALCRAELRGSGARS
jgi:chemotaxis protein methyltransferase CheR